MDDDLERASGTLQDALGELRSIFGMEVSGRIGQGHVPGFCRCASDSEGKRSAGCKQGYGSFHPLVPRDVCGELPCKDTLAEGRQGESSGEITPGSASRGLFLQETMLCVAGRSRR